MVAVLVFLSFSGQSVGRQKWRQWERTVIYLDGDNDARREENNRGISVN